MKGRRRERDSSQFISNPQSFSLIIPSNSTLLEEIGFKSLEKE